MYQSHRYIPSAYKYLCILTIFFQFKNIFLKYTEIIFIYSFPCFARNMFCFSVNKSFEPLTLTYIERRRTPTRFYLGSPFRQCKAATQKNIGSHMLYASQLSPLSLIVNFNVMYRYMYCTCRIYKYKSGVMKYH